MPCLQLQWTVNAGGCQRTAGRLLLRKGHHTDTNAAPPATCALSVSCFQTSFEDRSWDNFMSLVTPSAHASSTATTMARDTNCLQRRGGEQPVVGRAGLPGPCALLRRAHMHS